MVYKQELLKYAYDQFEQGAYDAALEAFVLVYSKGYEREWVLNNIYNCYMTANEVEFHETYDIWCRLRQAVKYEECPLDFIPYREGEYYIFDKEIQEFLGMFSAKSVIELVQSDDLRQTEFSAAVTVLNWDWKDQVEALSEAKYRKVYAVCQDINRCGSFFKIPELIDYAKNIVLFSDKDEFQKYFHEHTSVYLPKLCIGTEEEKNSLEALQEIINQEHEFRLTPEGRNTDRVLLSIGIPTYERGNLLLKRLEILRQLQYDSEIEFVISKNGNTLYQEEYRRIPTIKDARIRYIGYDDTLTAWDNCKNVMRIATGKFVLIVSDEDQVIVSALEHYLHFLSLYEDLAMIRAKTQVQCRIIDQTLYAKKGKNALFLGFLRQNYMSGAIYHRERFWASGIEKWDEKYFLKNSFYTSYPHMWCQVLLSNMGDYLEDAVCLISEGDSAYDDMKAQYKMIGSKLADEYQWKRDIPEYSTWESRIEQYKDAMIVIEDFAKGDYELEGNMKYGMYEKTVFLMKMVKEKYLPEERIELANLFLEQVRLVKESQGIEWSKEDEKRVLDSLID